MSSLKDKIRELELIEIVRALRETGWVLAQAARSLGITERMIGYKVKKYGIRKDAEPSNAEDPHQPSRTGRSNLTPFP